MAKRTDANQVSIVEALRAIGAWVFDTHCQGRGYPDINVIYRGKFFYMEIKNGNGRLTPAEQKFRDECPVGWHYVVRDPQEAIDVVQFQTGER